MREWDDESWKRLGGWMVEGMKAVRKGLVKVKVVGDREAEICSVRKDVAGVVVLAGWRREVWCLVNE